MEERVERWLQGYCLPSEQDPIYSLQSTQLELLRLFFALLALHSSADDPVAAARELQPGFPAFPLDGWPSIAVATLGLAREEAPGAPLQQRLLAQLDEGQRAALLWLVER